MNAVNDILSRVPMGQLADELGTDQATAEQAARQAITTLMGGMEANASNPQGAASLAEALNHHANNNPFANASDYNLTAVDTTDGEKIVDHVLGNNPEQQAMALGGTGGLLGNDQVRKLLAKLAPIVLGYIAGQVTSGKYGDILGKILGHGQEQQTQAEPTPEPRRGGGLRDILGQILGGQQPEPQAPPAQQAPAQQAPTAPQGAPSTGGFPVDNSVDDGLNTGDQDTAEKREEGRGGLGGILDSIFGTKN